MNRSKRSIETVLHPNSLGHIYFDLLPHMTQDAAHYLEVRRGKITGVTKNWSNFSKTVDYQWRLIVQDLDAPGNHLNTHENALLEYFC
jgi:hypothetical protein